MSKSLLGQLADRFAWLEKEGVRVGMVWISSEDAHSLESSGAVSMPVSDVLREPMNYVGNLWGAKVYHSLLVTPGHVALVPRGMEAKLVDSEACIPLRRPSTIPATSDQPTDRLPPPFPDPSEE